MNLNFVTGNENKSIEFKLLLPEYSIKTINIPLVEIQGTTQQISMEKCRNCIPLIKDSFCIEDTCLGFNALNGLPGPYIKDFLSSIGCDGLFKLLQGFNDKTAFAKTTIGYYDGNKIHLFEGI
jgi:inosine triphosphate pyrophosphatase